MYAELQKTYGGKKVFLTGHTGFKGAWMLKILHMLGAEVKGYALAPETDADLFNLIDGPRLCTSIIKDIRQTEVLLREVTEFAPDFIFHLAAQPLVRLSYEIPAATFEVNAIGTAYLLDAVRALPGTCSVVLITTDKVYRNNEWPYPYRETDRLGGYDPYSASKACTELVIDSYRNSFFNPAAYERHGKGIAVGRAGNVIGGGDWNKDRLIPDTAKALGSGQKIVIRNPAAVRPWQHVLEPLAGYLLLGAKLSEDPQRYAEAYNFGPYAADALPVSDMVSLALEKWGSGDWESSAMTGQPHEAGLLKLDISKATGALGWTPKMNASGAVGISIDWYRQYYSGGDMDAFTKAQINTFFAREPAHSPGQ